MAQHHKFSALLAFLTVLTLLFGPAKNARSDPLPGRDLLKFQQQPMVQTQIEGAVYHGHDEFSMLYGISGFGDPNPDPGVISTEYTGTTMADDFADGFDTPVVHVRWWGSYQENSINPDFPIDRFLIAFESDLPAEQNLFPWSQPDEVLSTQIVNRGPLQPGSGTFTETRIFSDPAGNEDIYEYNAELHLGKEFFQEPETVYWIKIAALLEVTDVNQDGIIDFSDLSELAVFGPRWGWHNRDYTVPDPFALAVTPPVQPGERDERDELGIAFPTEVWHFQDDAVSNALTELTLDLAMPDMPVELRQNPFRFEPQSYVNGLDGPVGISRFSKDLAFELYTIPEPGTWMLMILALGVIVTMRRTTC